MTLLKEKDDKRTLQSALKRYQRCCRPDHRDEVVPSSNPAELRRRQSS